jgi:hypothetical protein
VDTGAKQLMAEMIVDMMANGRVVLTARVRTVVPWMMSVHR